MDENIYPTKTVLKMASYDGENMGKLFTDTLTEDLGPIYKILRDPKPIKMTKADELNFKRAKKCYTCKIKFGSIIKDTKGKEQKVIKCRDHCHITGKYRGTACDKFNLRIYGTNVCANSVS